MSEEYVEYKDGSARGWKCYGMRFLVCLFEGEVGHIDDRLDGIWHLIPGRKGLPPQCEA